VSFILSTLFYKFLGQFESKNVKIYINLAEHFEIGSLLVIHRDITIGFRCERRKVYLLRRIAYFFSCSCNDLWVLDINQMTWCKKEVGDARIRSRYGQSQIVIDKTHILIIGGCGGPNMVGYI
jgi:hypothetical protein